MSQFSKHCLCVPLLKKVPQPATSLYHGTDWLQRGIPLKTLKKYFQYSLFHFFWCDFNVDALHDNMQLDKSIVSFLKRNRKLLSCF